MWLRNYPPAEDTTDGLPLPKLTDCYDTETPGVSLNARRAFQVIVAACVMALLGVGQVYLRFAIQETRVEHERIQHEHAELNRRITSLEIDYARLSDPERLRTLAVDSLQMQDVDLQSQVLAVIPPALTRRYMAAVEPSSAGPGEDDGIPAIQETGRGSRLVRTLLDVNRAFAQPLVHDK